jgi:hypothetical protein
MKLFTDRELPTEETISVSVWNGIVALINDLIDKNCLSEDFSEYCLDDRTSICGFDRIAFQDSVKSRLPDIDIPINRKNEFQEEMDIFGIAQKTIPNEIDTSITFDLIEFVYSHISDPIQKSYHSYFQHHHYVFEDGHETQENFRNEINDIFSSNGIVFFLDENGEMKRIIPDEYEEIFDYEYLTEDDRLNDLIDDAINHFKKSCSDDREIALEKLWDAFERLKTYNKEDNKKVSIEKLINLAASGNEQMKQKLSTECKELTDIGNNFQIRHFETDKSEITDSTHVEYLFYRLLSFIHLIVKNLE